MFENELFDVLQEVGLDAWLDYLPEQIEKGLNTERFGDLPKWQAALDSFPDLAADKVKFTSKSLGTSIISPIILF